MKTLTAALLSAFLVTGGVSAALAQPGGSPAGSPTTPANPGGGDKAPAASSSSSSSTAAPSAPAPSDSKTSETKSSTSTDVRGSVKTDRDDSGSALPRSTTVERTTIFGLSPTAAVIIAAALLLVVILAIVAMTRSKDTYIDTNRRV